MSRHDTLHDALFAAGAAPIEPVEPRLDDLERRVFAAIDSEDRSNRLVVVPATPSRVRHGSRRLLAIAAAVVVLAVAGALLLPTQTDDGLIIAAAGEVSVVLPGGDEVTGAEGVELPDGALIEVRGFLEVGGRTFGPGRYEVDGDDLVALPASEASTTSTTASDSSDSKSESTVVREAPAPTIREDAVTVSDQPSVTGPSDTTTSLPERDDVDPTTPDRAVTGTDVAVRPSPTSSPSRPTTTVARTTTSVARTTTTTVVASTTTTLASSSTVRDARPSPTRPTDESDQTR